jgi:N-carbamoyl-L-amino-acid hydrolase
VVDLRVNAARLTARLDELAELAPIPGGGCSRVALTDDDRRGRDLVVAWMKDLGLRVEVDRIGNVIGTWDVGVGAPVMTGSHIDTVRTGGRFDGNLGVLAGLEVIETCRAAGLEPSRPLAVAFFTNEEGSRFAPDMLGSLVYAGGMGLEEALSVTDADGITIGSELERIGYAGATPCPGLAPHSFVELHIEQGPVLEARGVTIGAVTGVQGISWQRLEILGQSNHAGTTPMEHRRDPAVVAARIAVFLRELAERYGSPQVCTVGNLTLHPNQVNVVPARAVMTLDVRNTDETVLRTAEAEIAAFVAEVAAQEGVSVDTTTLARFEPVVFDQRIVEMVSETARNLGHTVMELPSGAGHDAQMIARMAPTAMIFVPSIAGISHNPAEDTDPADLEAGANVLLQVMLRLAEVSP